MARRKQNAKSGKAGRDPRKAKTAPVGLRIVGGRFRGRKLEYGGDQRVRPMKDRIREAVFNLVGPSVAKKHAIDLFGGTGALGLEALSRGADRATFIEQHYPTAAILRRNVATLQVEQITEVFVANVFLWLRGQPDLGSAPWVVFCSPPYEFYVSRTEQMMGLVGELMRLAPAESIFVVESDERFDFSLLPEPDQWDVRTYPPAVVGMYRKEG